MKRTTKKRYTNLKGIVVPYASYSQDTLALLTTEGKTLPIVKNEKFNFLKNLIWESVSVFGRLVKDSAKKEALEVIFFTSSTPSNLLLDSDVKMNSTTCA